jgi:hypothetical protein
MRPEKRKTDPPPFLRRIVMEFVNRAALKAFNLLNIAGILESLNFRLVNFCGGEEDRGSFILQIMNKAGFSVPKNILIRPIKRLDQFAEIQLKSDRTSETVKIPVYLGRDKEGEEDVKDFLSYHLSS